jgi:hypothetical protein
MFAKNMESILTSLCEKSDVSHGAPNEAAERFDALRRYGRLPRGREKRGESSTNADVAAAISGLTTPPRLIGRDMRAILRKFVCSRWDRRFFLWHFNTSGVN